MLSAFLPDQCRGRVPLRGLFEGVCSEKKSGLKKGLKKSKKENKNTTGKQKEKARCFYD